MDGVGRGGCLNQKQYDIIVRFLAHGHFPSKRDLMEAKFASQEETARPRPFRKFKSWIQRLLYRESENVLIHLPTGKVVVPKERFVPIIVANHCDESGCHLNAFSTMKKIQKTYTFGRRNFGMSEAFVRAVIRSCPTCEVFRSGNVKEGMLAAAKKIGKQLTATECTPNDKEQNFENPNKKVFSSTSSELGTEKHAQTISSAADGSNQSGHPMDRNQTEVNKDKTNVKESHPIIHGTLLSQMMTAKTSVVTETSQSASLTLPLLRPISVSMIQHFRNTHLKATEGLYASAGNTVKQIPSSTQAVTKASSASASKVLGINSKLGSLMTPKTLAVGMTPKTGTVGMTPKTGTVGMTPKTGAVGMTPKTGAVGMTPKTGAVGMTPKTGTVGMTPKTGAVGMTPKTGTVGMTPKTGAVGCYVKVPNSSSPTGFSISFVATPLVSLNSSTLCSPSTSLSTLSTAPPLMPTLCSPSTSLSTLNTAPPLMPKDGTAAKTAKSTLEKTVAIHLQKNTACPKLSTINNQSKTVTEPIHSQPKIVISTNQTNILPPIKLSEKKLDKALQKPKDNNTDSSSILSTPTKKRVGEVKKNTSSGVKKKLKLKLNKGDSGKRQKKFPSPKSAKAHFGKSSRKNGDENEGKLDKSCKELNDETFKKIILVNPEKMKKILANRLRIPSMNINIKGQCSVTFHDKSRNVHTSFIVDEGSTTADQSAATSLLGEEPISRKGGSSCKDFRGTSKKDLLGSPAKCCEEIPFANKSPDAETQQNSQQTETCPFDVNQIMSENFTERGDSFTRDTKSHIGSAIRNSDKPSTPLLLPDPGPIPCPAIWSFSEEMLTEKNCYGRLLIAIQDMRMDVMKSILSDYHAMDRLKKKMGYAETLINKQKYFITSFHEEMDWI